MEEGVSSITCQVCRKAIHDVERVVEEKVVNDYLCEGPWMGGVVTFACPHCGFDVQVRGEGHTEFEELVVDEVAMKGDPTVTVDSVVREDLAWAPHPAVGTRITVEVVRNDGTVAAPVDCTIVKVGPNGVQLERVTPDEGHVGYNFPLDVLEVWDLPPYEAGLHGPIVAAGCRSE